MALSKKHFERIAAEIKSVNTQMDPSPEYAVQRAAARAAINLITDKLVDMFREENPRFDEQRFLKACGF